MLKSRFCNHPILFGDMFSNALWGSHSWLWGTGLNCNLLEKFWLHIQGMCHLEGCMCVVQCKVPLPRLPRENLQIKWININNSLSDCFNSHTGAAVHLASLLAAYGYIFSITDHHLMVKDDASYYRFQVCWTLTDKRSFKYFPRIVI